MAITATDGAFDEPADTTGCWSCGDRTVRGSLLRLGEHPEVGICFRCVPILAGRKRQIERRTRAAPHGWSPGRRLLFRLGWSRC
jgi:hypothetical protein